ncbi:unnamed protein product [Parnassius apollo]|uniref:(apollo) hypothetical protein n=1 Tax=Parnassius apollo TaxID=110799 RepID=A0A8S3WBR2_PARAO|nr:unnamed protein product [Parnassius apollo]
MEPKGNIAPEHQNNRARGVNCTQEEKDLFLEIMRESAPIIESKFTDTNTNKMERIWSGLEYKRENLYDGDAVPQLQGEFIVIGGTEEQNNTLYDIDEASEEPAVQQMITVANVHSEEQKNTNGISSKEKKKQNREKKTNKLAGKEALLRSNIEFKERASAMLEEEHKLKIKFQEQEIAHQQLRHKLEIDILLLEKDKKKLELELLKKN